VLMFEERVRCMEAGLSRGKLEDELTKCVLNFRQRNEAQFHQEFLVFSEEKKAEVRSAL
jgi:hypothetical protein